MGNHSTPHSILHLSLHWSCVHFDHLTGVQCSNRNSQVKCSAISTPPILDGMLARQVHSAINTRCLSPSHSGHYRRLPRHPAAHYSFETSVCAFFSSRRERERISCALAKRMVHSITVTSMQSESHFTRETA